MFGGSLRDTWLFLHLYLLEVDCFVLKINMPELLGIYRGRGSRGYFLIDEHGYISSMNMVAIVSLLGDIFSHNPNFHIKGNI